MKDALALLPRLRSELSHRRCAILLDFDGTLAPIVRRPGDAALSARTRASLRSLAKRHAVAIVSGRSLADIRRRVGIDGLIYAGNHGFEWRIGPRRGQLRIPARTARDLSVAARAMRKVAARFPGALAEHKGYTLSLHYRALTEKRSRSLMRDALAAVAPYMESGRLRISHGKKVLEVRPSIAWHKGDFARMLLRRLRRPRTTLYIGDDTTDEDAFLSLPRDITIRVGKSAGSAARYYLPSQRSVADFLESLTAEE